MVTITVTPDQYPPLLKPITFVAAVDKNMDRYIVTNEELSIRLVTSDLHNVVERIVDELDFLAGFYLKRKKSEISHLASDFLENLSKAMDKSKIPDDNEWVIN